jgi:putative ABC transport system ATP-binding protein
MLLKLKNVSKTYEMGEIQIHALLEVSVEIHKGEFVAIMGPSGSGKSTFLQVASMLSAATAGEIFLEDKQVEKYNEVEQARLRNQEIGFVFQQFNLLPRTSALDNVALPLLYAKVGAEDRNRRAVAMLAKVGLSDRMANKPSQLSGGQQQRVAIARALINDPAIIFADEPTGNLDSKSGDEIKKILTDLNKEKRTIIMVTHEEDVASIAKRMIFFQDGEIVYDDKFGWNQKRKVPLDKTVKKEIEKKVANVKKLRK